MSNKQVINLDFLEREANLYKEAKNDIKTTGTLVRKTIEEHTKTEVEEVENAIKKLNGKIEQIMKTDFIKDKEQKIKKASEQINKSMDVAYNTFLKVRKIINEHPKLNNDQKKAFEKKLYDKIIDKFITKEEKEMFERLMTSGNIIIMGGNGGNGGNGMGGNGMGGNGMGGNGGNGMGGIKMIGGNNLL
jgi:hypothetical protein